MSRQSKLPKRLLNSETLFERERELIEGFLRIEISNARLAADDGNTASARGHLIAARRLLHTLELQTRVEQFWKDHG